METPLDILMKATRYVENQGCNNSIRAASSPLRNQINDSSKKENGHSDHSTTMYRSLAPVNEAALSRNQSHKQQVTSKNTSEQSEQTTDKNQETMRMQYSNELSSADETVSSSQYNRNVSNGLMPRMYAEEKHANSTSPMRSPPRKRSSSPSVKSDLDQRAKIHAGHPLNALGVPTGHPVSHLQANPLMPLINPYLTAGFDPALYAEAFARQSLVNSEVSRPGASPASSSSAPSAIESLSSQTIPRLLYPAFPSNPALLMGHRAPSASAYPISDFPMVLPPQLAAAYGQTAGLFPQQLGAWPTVEGMSAGLAPGQPLPAQWLANPYLKNFLSAAGNDIATNKEASRSLPKTAAPPGLGYPNYANYTADFMLKYPEALAAEALKQESALASRSMSPQRSTSPEIKKPSIPTHHLQYAPSVLNPPSLSKSPASDWKISGTTSRLSKPDTRQAGLDSRQSSTLRRDIAYGDNQESHVKTEEAKQKLVSLTQRAGPINDVYATRYAHERQSPSPYTERWENRRRSRDFSPHLSPATGEKSAKKRSHEGFGIPRDLIPDRKNHSPSTQAPFSGLRHSKSPLKHQAKSPPEHTGQTTSTNKLYMNSPYVFPPLATAGLPFSLPPGSYMNELNGPAVNKTVADAITAASLSQVSQFLRPSLPQESAMNDLMLAQYVSCLQSQQLQALKALTPSSSSPDYLTAFKQAAVHQSMLQDGRSKDAASPQTSMAYRRYTQNQTSSPAPKMPCVSPVSQQSKTALRNPTSALNHIYKPQSFVADGRNIKRETGSPSTKFLPSNVTENPQNLTKMSTSEAVKRRAAEEFNERSFKETVLKQKREQATDVDEHFRRSLGTNYKPPDGQNKVRITGSVDDHFHKALGNVWDKYKPSKTASPPQSVHALPNGRDVRPLLPPTSIKGSQLPPGLPPYTSLYSGMPMDPVTAHQLYLSSAGKSIKTTDISRTESTVASPKPSQSVLDASVLAAKRASAFYPEMRTQLPTYDAASRLQMENKETANMQQASSPVENLSKKTPTTFSSHTPTPPNINNQAHSPLPQGYHTSSASRTPHSAQSSNGLIKSPPKAPPPVYSPQNNVSGVPLTTSASPRPTIDRQSSGDSNLTVPMSVPS